MQDIIRVNNLSVNYQQTNALADISLTVPNNVRMAIVGPNGAGKSTFIKAILDLIPAKSQGITFFEHESLKEARSRIAYVPQTSEVNWNFPTTVFDVVLMGIASKRFGFQPIKREQKDKVHEALEAMELTELANRQINQLSGGQKQRVFIARAIAQDAQLYFFDEPLAGVDMKSEAIIMDQLKKFQQAGKTSLTVHHDLNTVPDYFDHVLFLNKKRITDGPVATTFTKTNIDLAYLGQSLSDKEPTSSSKIVKLGDKHA